MLFVIPGEEIPAERPGILNGPEPIGEFGTVLQGFELCFGIWIVIAHMRTAMGFGDSQIRKKMGNGL